MHISEGLLSAPILVSGGVVAVLGTYFGLRNLKDEDIPKTAVFTSAFFIVGLIHFPLGGTSVHLTLNGLCGIVLGTAVFPAILIALFLQALLFSHGGLTVLGVNTVVMAFPALLSYFITHPILKKKSLSETIWFSLGMFAGGLSCLLSMIITVLALYFTNSDRFNIAIKIFIFTNLPILFIEALITGGVLVFLRRLGLAHKIAATASSLKKSVISNTKSILCILFFLLFAFSASAHKINIFAAENGDIINGYLYAPGGIRIKNAEVSILCKGKRVETIFTDNKGEFSYKPDSTGEYLFQYSIEGHMAKCKVAGMQNSTYQYLSPSSQKQSPENHEFHMIIKKEVEKAIYPLRQQLEEIKSELRFRDIIGGVGYILGFFGLYSFLYKKKGKKDASD
ncbi:MAG: cobalt transporter CbiM [Verrucomicrobiota bacterium]|nr:cobalt transporter CbiM [Verrucomicrobiota bacterium]